MSSKAAKYAQHMKEANAPVTMDTHGEPSSSIPVTAYQAQAHNWAEGRKQFNLGHAHGLKAANSGEPFNVESDHPSYQAGLAHGLYAAPHPGPGAV